MQIPLDREKHKRILEMRRQKPPVSIQKIAKLLNISTGVVSKYKSIPLEGAPEPTTASLRNPDAEEPTGAAWQSKSRYVYNDITDTYVTFISCCPNPIVIPGETHRAMARAYSNWNGQPASINEICRTFNFPRPWFVEYRRIHAFTHDKEPFSIEEVATRETDDLVDESLQMRRQALYQKFEKAKWQDVKKAAEQWWDFQEGTLNPFLAKVSGIFSDKVPSLDLKPAKRRYAVVAGPMDYHYGKYGWTDEVGKGYSRPIARERLIERTSALLSHIAHYGAPEKFIATIGSDFLHVDTEKGTTTSGTPQDLDGTPSQILTEGAEMKRVYIDMLLQVAPVDLYIVPGNHDRLLSTSLLLIIDAFYRDNPRVKVHRSSNPRQYAVYGKTLIGFTHGDGVKPVELAQLMAAEASEDWGRTTHRCYFTGHWHQEIVRPIGGIMQYVLPSISGHDRYHSEHGYVLSRAALAGYMVDHEDGVIANLISPVPKA